MSDDLRARLTALAEEFRSEIDWSGGRNNYGDNEAWESAASRIDALLADPAPEAARVPLRFAQHLAVESLSPRCEVTADDGRARCPEDAVAVRWECGFADSVCQRHAETAAARGAFVALARRHDGTEAAPADLPVATGVTTEDEGCLAGHLEHGACACPTPAPVVSAGDEGKSESDITKASMSHNAPMTSMGDEGVGLSEDDVLVLATAIYEGGNDGEWLTTIDGSPNSASYALAHLIEPVLERILAARVAEAGARALRDAADEWDDPAKSADLRALAEREYHAGGPSMPAIWLRCRADQIEATQ